MDKHCLKVKCQLAAPQHPSVFKAGFPQRTMQQKQRGRKDKMCWEQHGAALDRGRKVTLPGSLFLQIIATSLTALLYLQKDGCFLSP